MTVLYVDDAMQMREFVAATLTRTSGVRLLTADLGGVGLRLARDYQPDLIITDLYLPDMGGEALLLKLRADRRTRTTPVVILSGDTLRRRRAALLAAGASEYLTKPIGVPELLAVVERYRP